MFSFLKKKSFLQNKKNKVFVLGIDGVPCSLLRMFIDDGTMPNLRRISQNGSIREMTASIPEISSTSWSTFMTGVNPGKHGIFGFTELHRETYQWRFPNSYSLKSKTLWDIAGSNDMKSVVLNVPSTYPARRLNGILTAGFVAIDLKAATYPESAYKYLKGIDYRIDVNAGKARESIDAFTHDITTTFNRRKEAILYFMENTEWDLFIGVITETDRLHHYLWAALHEDAHPQHEFFLNFYRQIDEFIGIVHEKTGSEAPFIIVSDHGFTTIKKELYLNNWLRDKGYLKFRHQKPEDFRDLHEDSTVFVLDPARFYIHLKNRFSRGCVEQHDYEDLRREIQSDLLSLTVDGEKIIKEVLLKEDIYHGDEYDNAPDIVALPHTGFDLKGAINKTNLTGKGMLTGGHTREDALFFINRQVEVSDINIVDVGPTIISLLGISENGFDGRCLVKN
jgi:predicted AlkP superfamily phosphohydrolase/phosphomutase